MSIMIIRWLGCQLFIPTFFCAPLLYEWVSSQTDLYWRRQNSKNAFLSSISLTRKHFWVAPPNTRRLRYTRKAYRRYDTFMMLLKYKIKICSKEKGLQPKNLSRWNDFCLSLSAGLGTFRYFFEMNFAFEKSQTLQNMLKPRVKASAQ